MVRRATRAARSHSSPGRSTAYRLGAKHPAATIARQTSQRIPGVLLHSRPVTVYTLGPLDAAAGGASSRCWRHTASAASPTCGASRRRGDIRTSRARHSSARSPAAGIDYDWLPALGGRRPARPDSPHVGWREAGFRGYADHMDDAGVRRGPRGAPGSGRRAADRDHVRRGRPVALPPSAHRRRARSLAASTVLHVIDAASRADRTAQPSRSPRGRPHRLRRRASSAAARVAAPETLCHDPRPMSKIVHVVSHGPHCLDGVTAAVAVARYYGDHARGARDLRQQQRDRRRAAGAPARGRRRARALDHRHLLARAGDRRAPARARRATASASSGSTTTAPRSSA